jgi:group I intron endonuclease
MSIYTIYKATCKTTQKSYYGFDSNWPTRKKNHYSQHKKDKKNTKFYNAIRKYGWDDFVWEVVYQSKDFEHTLDYMEPYFIKENNTLNFGYNMTPGGEGKKLGSVESNETKRRKSLAHKGKKLSRETIQKMLISKKGYKHSSETIEKLRQFRLGKEPSNKGTKSIRCCCLTCKKEVDIGNLGRHHKHIPK